jgi:disulfide bond formation protein DsbB
MLETMPLAEVLGKVFSGDGSCAEVQWSFLGLSMPTWTLLWYIGLSVVTLYFTLRASRVEESKP